MYQTRFLSFTGIAAVAVGIWAVVTQVDPQLPEHHSPTLSGNVVLDSDINLNLGTISPGNSPNKNSITSFKK